MSGKKAIIVWGGWDGHEPAQCAAHFENLLKKEGCDVQLFDDVAVYEDTDTLNACDLIVQCVTMGKLGEEATSGLVGAVTKGVGLAGWHGGLCDSFRDNTEYQFLVGGQFVAHPGGMKDYRVCIADCEDPIVSELGDFDLHTEQYYMHVDPSNHVLATTTFQDDAMPWIEGCVMPVAWKRMWGKGRIFYSSIGHCLSDFQRPEVAQITIRGMLWAAQSDR